jgi:hypothetical protein
VLFSIISLLRVDSYLRALRCKHRSGGGGSGGARRATGGAWALPTTGFEGGSQRKHGFSLGSSAGGGVNGARIPKGADTVAVVYVILFVIGIVAKDRHKAVVPASKGRNRESCKGRGRVIPIPPYRQISTSRLCSLTTAVLFRLCVDSCYPQRRSSPDLQQRHVTKNSIVR